MRQQKQPATSPPKADDTQSRFQSWNSAPIFGADFWTVCHTDLVPVFFLVLDSGAGRLRALFCADFWYACDHYSNRCERNVLCTMSRLLITITGINKMDLSIFVSSMLIFGTDFLVPDRIWYEKSAPNFSANFWSVCHQLKITWLSVDSNQPDVMDAGVEWTFPPQKFLNVPLEVGGWPLGYEERRCWAIIDRAISFQDFWPTILSVVPLAHCVIRVCLSVMFCIAAKQYVADKSEGANKKRGSKSWFLGRRHISTSGFASTATETAVFALFLPV